MESKPRVLIVGASIAGLTAATTLMQTGSAQVIIFERSPKITIDEGRHPKSGGGIGLHEISTQILNSIGITNWKDFAIPMPYQEDRDRDGRVIRWGSVPLYSAYWGDVHKALSKSSVQSGAEIHYEKNVVGLTESQTLVSLKFSDGSVVSGDCVIGADGIISCVRAYMFTNLKQPDLVRYSGYYAWRGLVRWEDLTHELKTEVQATFSKGTLTFDISEKSHGVVYYLKQGVNWIIYLNNDPDATPSYHAWDEVNGNITRNPSPDEVKSFCSKVKVLYRPIFLELIRLTKTPFINHMYDRDVISKYSTDRCVLIGDAAHPPTPHFVRGSNMAIQDGYALGKLFLAHISTKSVDSKITFQNAFKQYENERVKICNEAVLTSRRLGRVKQGVFSTKQSSDWDLKCTCSELSEMLGDGIPSVETTE